MNQSHVDTSRTVHRLIDIEQPFVDSRGKGGPSLIRRGIARMAIRLARALFRGTWVHRLRLANLIYGRIFRASHDLGDQELLFRGNHYLVPSFDVSMFPSLRTGDYESFELDVFEAVVRAGMTILDVGANIGV